MSTRVHELAKEMGMKSQELLDHIQRGGIDVKPSPLASLDEATVTRIKQLLEGPVGKQKADGSAAAPAPKPVEEQRTSSAASAHAAKPVESRPLSSSSESKPSVAPAAQSKPSIAPAAQSKPSVAPPERSETRPAASSGPVSRPPTGQEPPRPSQSALTSPPVGPRPSQGGGGSGPLAGHTRHSSGGPVHRSGQRPSPTPPPAPPATARGGDEVAAPAREPRPGGGPAAMRQHDYISPSGTRSNAQRPAPIPPAQPPLRRQPPQQGPGQGGGEQRRESGGGSRPSSRPLPSISTSGSTAPPRREPPRQPAAPAAKTQRPQVRYTPQQLREMMERGQLGTTPPGVGSSPPRGGAPPQARRNPPPGAGAPPSPTPPMPGTAEFEEEERKGAKGGGRTGIVADRASRRARRELRANERTRVTSPVDARTILEGEEDSRGVKALKRHKGNRGAVIAPRKDHAEIEPPITVRSLSEATGIKANDLIRKLMSLGQVVNINANLDIETSSMLSMEFGIELEIVGQKDIVEGFEELFEETETIDEDALEPRPPVITILGHVDHGKTSLLDRIRRANVVASETGGITQHIGAYQIKHGDKKITFVDTPGHEAFTAMRARGANVTDIAVVVVAADDGVMPQTREAIAHAKAAEVPVVVALNKIDLPNVESTSNINKIYSELSQEGLNPVEWGGETEVIRTSTQTARGIEDLLSTLEIVAELRNMKANPGRPATGTCLESSISEGRGVVATVLVQDGTLKVGDAVVCGDTFGKVRALHNDLGQPIQEAGPSTPVEISGLDMVPTAGEKFAAIDDISRAREIAETRRSRTRSASLNDRPPAVTLENIFAQFTQQKLKTLNLILKADVQGSLEALVKELDKLENPEVPVRILFKGVGGISESDVLLADASQAIVVGFRVAPEDRAITLAEEKDIDIRRYDIIYQVTDEVKKAIEGLLVPEVKETQIGRAVVRQAFRISRIGTVAGCVVTQGNIERTSKVRLIREGREIYKGAIEALKRFKDDVREVREGYECGLKISNFDDIKVDDVIEAYRVDVIRRTL